MSGIVFLDELLEEGVLGAMAHIRRRAATRAGFLASRHATLQRLKHSKQIL